MDSDSAHKYEELVTKIAVWRDDIFKRVQSGELLVEHQTWEIGALLFNDITAGVMLDAFGIGGSQIIAFALGTMWVRERPIGDDTKGLNDLLKDVNV